MPTQHLPIARWLAEQRRLYGLTWLATAQRADVNKNDIRLRLRAEPSGRTPQSPA